MTIDRPRPTVFEVTLHAYELSALIAAARWAVEEGELPEEAARQLQEILKSYDAEIQRLDEK